MRHPEPGTNSGATAVMLKMTRAIAGIRADISFALVDTFIVMAAYAIALLARFADRQGTIDPEWWSGFWSYLPLIVAIHLLANAVMGAYGHVWEFASVEEAMRLVIATLSSVLLLVLGLIGAQAATDAATRLVPLTVILMGGGLTLGGMGAVRFRSRLFSFRRSNQLEVRRALVVGTGRACADLARRGLNAVPPVLVVGFVDDAPSQRKLAGSSVLGGISALPALIREHDIHEVIIDAGKPAAVNRAVVDYCVDVDVQLRTLPAFDGIIGSPGVADVRDLELSDLLSRPPVNTDLEAVRSLITGRRVLVTGAGGSIGSEIVTQVMRFDPAELVALDNDEGHLYEAGLGWADLLGTPLIRLADIRDHRALDWVMTTHRPHIVFHAAAHKHVPILEAHPEEAVKTNVVGTYNLLKAARRSGVERFVLISTDKAVEPTSVMGASKRTAEMLMQSAAGASMVTSAVRFGNVLGSRGSVVPTFVRQIQNGGPVTVSDPEMLRYFMLTSEAVELVLQASALTSGGEIYVLDMGDPVRIGDLAHQMIRLAGLVPGRDIEVAVTGARPGEKLIERLSDQPLLPSSHPSIGLASGCHPGPVTVLDAVEVLGSLAERGESSAIREVLMALAWHTGSRDEEIDLRGLASEALNESA